jgi:cytochrome c oxidase accessory protein FixG
VTTPRAGSLELPRRDGRAAPRARKAGASGLFGARSVRGRFRSLRSAADAVLIAILFAIPWIRIGGEPLVLLDVPARKFHVFGLVIFPQELYFLWLILTGAALSLFFFTALFGRVWCGWACPQTVFTDLFAAIARRIEGWRGLLPPSRVAPWRRVLKYAVLLAASAVIGFHLVGYFRSPYELLPALGSGNLSGPSVGFLTAATALSFFDFVILRQTFCKYLCPYARFQGVLFDRDTLVVGYDARRGEPRGKAVLKGQGLAGDCVDCGLCVAVCPTGIDIRKGMQLECIACTQCIDACDGVMGRLGRAPNLIGYRSLVGLEGERPVRIVRPRVVIYFALLLVVGTGFAAALARRLPMDLYVAHNRESLATRAADGRVGNSFDLRIENRDRTDRSFTLAIEEPGFELLAGENPVPVAATSAVETRVFVLARPEDVPAGQAPIHFVLAGDGSRRIVRSARFIAAGAAPGAPHGDTR